MSTTNRKSRDSLSQNCENSKFVLKFPLLLGLNYYLGCSCCIFSLSCRVKHFSIDKAHWFCHIPNGIISSNSRLLFAFFGKHKLIFRVNTNFCSFCNQLAFIWHQWIGKFAILLSFGADKSKACCQGFFRFFNGPFNFVVWVILNSSFSIPEVMF